ncbi:MAG: hypothetical protein WCG47_13905, partial [Dermatophilaceae bacterium]
MNQRITRYAPYLWLVYLIALVFQPTFDPDTSAVDWVATAVMVAAFLPLYRAGLAERDQRRLTVLLAAMAGLGVVGTDPGQCRGGCVHCLRRCPSRTSLPGQKGCH